MKYKMKFLLPVMFFVLFGLIFFIPWLGGPFMFALLPGFIFIPIIDLIDLEPGDHTFLSLALAAMGWFLIGCVLDFFLAKLKIARARLRDWESRKGFR